MTRLPLRLVLAAVVAMIACSKSPTGPQPGTLSVHLQSPNSGLDGAILFTLTGPNPVTNVVAGTGDTLWSTDFSGNTSKILLTGTIRSGVILSFGVPDVNVSDQYIVSINQAASSSDYSLRSLVSYVPLVAK
ncbi:MAG TPA: hypothetical protein VH163_11390 [Gemmatimonadales bacterium]|jgi:hypothetical protein|nr:hypothetical protein [Gemmatimonadales bacterium]